MNYIIKRISDIPRMKERAARWFCEKWGISRQAYLESMEESIKGAAVPRWYLALEEDRIVGGMGVIQNDFHERKDLYPNVCAVFTEEDRRGLGIAGRLLDFVCTDMKNQGIDTLYLLTDHTSFYERYGWQYLCMVRTERRGEMARVYVHRQNK